MVTKVYLHQLLGTVGEKPWSIVEGGEGVVLMLLIAGKRRRTRRKTRQVHRTEQKDSWEGGRRDVAPVAGQACSSSWVSAMVTSSLLLHLRRPRSPRP